MNETLIRKVESVLFGAGRRLSLEHIAKLCKTTEEKAKEALLTLQAEYQQKDTSLRVIEDGEFWKLTIRGEYASTVEKLVTQTELSKTVMETLAVIAYKAPVMQSYVIHVRTNKAYDHIILLEEMGFISRVKQGRSKLIRLTPKFYDYFDLADHALAARFAMVRQKEEEVAEIEKRKQELVEQIKKRKKELQKADEKQRIEHEEKIAELNAEINKLEVYQAQETFTEDAPTQLERITPHVGQLEVYDTVSKEGSHWGEFEVYVPGQKGSVEDTNELKNEIDVGEPGQEQPEEETPTPQETQPIQESPESQGQEEPATKPGVLESEPAEPEPLPEPEIKEEVQVGALEKKEGKGMFTEGITDEVQEKIDENIDRLLHPDKEQEETEEGESEKKDAPDLESIQSSQENVDETKEAGATEAKAADGGDTEEAKNVSAETELEKPVTDMDQEQDEFLEKEKTSEDADGQDLLAEPMTPNEEHPDDDISGKEPAERPEVPEKNGEEAPL